MENNRVSNRIETEISKKFPLGFHIAPKKEFYKMVGISQKRWFRVLSNELPVTIDELGRISAHFEIPLNRLIDEKSMNITESNS